MKSALIIDTPDRCENCKLYDEIKYCIGKDGIVEDESIIDKDCPLRPLPDKQVCNNYNFENFVNGRIRGWNDYYDILTKGVIGEVDE